MAWIGAEKKRFPLTGYDTPRQPDGKAIEIRRLSDGKILRVLESSQESEAVTFSPNGSKIVSVAVGERNTNGHDGSVIRCHSNNGKLLWQSDYRISNPKKIRYDTFCDAVFSPDGSNIAVLSREENRLLILDASNRREKRLLLSVNEQTTTQGIPSALAFSPDGKRLFARGRNSVLVWDLK